MTESDVQRLTTEVSQALENQQYAEAEELQRRAIELLQREGAEPSRFADELEKLAGIHYQQAKFGLAANEYDRVLKTREASLPASDDQVLGVLYWIGKSHFSDMKYDLAEAPFRRALAACETMPESPLNIGRFLCELGFLLYFVGRYQEAEIYLLRALEIYEKLHGETHQDTVWVLERIALDYKHCPEIGKEPEPYFRRAALALKPEEHKAEYAANVCRWAECLAESKRFEEADDVYGRLLPLIDETPEWRSEWHWILSNCVDYFKSRGKGELVSHLTAKENEYDAYGELTKQRLEHAERTLPDNDPELAEALFNAGNHAIFHQKYTEAEALLRRALDSNIKAHGEQSENVVATLNRLSLLLESLGVSMKLRRRFSGRCKSLRASSHIRMSTRERSRLFPSLARHKAGCKKRLRCTPTQLRSLNGRLGMRPTTRLSAYIARAGSFSAPRGSRMPRMPFDG